MYGTSRDIQRALNKEPSINDDAAKDWQRRGESLDLPPPSFIQDDFRWRLYRADGSVAERDPETGEWVTVDKAEK